ncbi:hypothetical protein LSS_11515 [Leptospira santarosai serovar Shermani str. LT 821]|uniref:Uncharacterized protein n=1 Tax=Leptospira santarosai serovar Shermani str. LT 821 TaxID=758847 RepID=K8XZ93_9LEPT|nr:hypothetical protein LSS_11515 [Leptospira santarosai serovar Shermani str. LT 821]
MIQILGELNQNSISVTRPFLISLFHLDDPLTDLPITRQRNLVPIGIRIRLKRFIDMRDVRQERSFLGNTRRRRIFNSHRKTLRSSPSKSHHNFHALRINSNIIIQYSIIY